MRTTWGGLAVVSLAFLPFSGACTAPSPPDAKDPPLNATASAAPRPAALPLASGTRPPSIVVDSKPAVPAATTEARYDLAQDIADREADAKKRLGRGTVTTVAGGVFVLVSAPGWNAAERAQSTSLVERSLGAYLNGRFDKKPDRAITVYLFASGASYGKFCKEQLGGPCISIFGFYRPDLRAMVMDAGRGLGTLTHELVHPLVEADFPEAPTWLNEGIASLFEAPVIPKTGEIHGAKNWRLPRLKTALASATEKKETQLDVLMAQDDDVFRGDKEDLHYATARYLCQWLDEQGKLWTFYRAFRDHVKDDPRGAKAFEAATGMTPRDANPKFVRWVSAL